jgi:DMSO/TMAO reductase YedYZ molybdopterin-dependent catalytic subunit
MERARPSDAASPDVPLVGRAVAVACGLAAGAVGLAVGEVVAGLDRDLRSPVVGVGDRVIDHVPASVKEWAIEQFGTSDKQALKVGIVATLAVLAALAGIVAIRRRQFAVAACTTAFVALVGAVAAVASPVQGPAGALPSLAAGVAAITVLGWLHHATGGRAVDAPGARLDRRNLLIGLGALAIGALGLERVGRSLRHRFAVDAERAALDLPTATEQLVAPVAGLEGEIPGLSPLFTPNDDFYRIDTALTVPTVSVDSWSLHIHGMVDREITLSFDELLARPLIETDVTLSCVSNEVGGRLVGTARWQGVRLDDLLAEAGIDPAADQIVGRSVDGFTAGFPVAVLDGRDAIVAIAMNGEPLPVPHGYPARLVVPGLYGYVSATKWLAEIEVTTFDGFEGYWIPRGWSAEGPIKTQSRIDVPRGSVDAGTVAVAGVAWAGVRGIDAVEVRVDDGPWVAAELGPELANTTWRQWWLPWNATPGRATLTVRATDGTGEVQTQDRTDPAPDGATGWHSVSVDVRG